MQLPKEIAEPRAAVCGLVLSGEPEPRVLLAKRSPELRFMANYHVFPGGCIDRQETAHRVVNATVDLPAKAIHAVAREVFEEAGVLCCCDAPPPLAQREEWQRQLLAGTLSFDAILDACEILLDAACFEPAGRWVTPIFAPIRFDTQYYLYHHRGDCTACHAGGEIVALDWLTAAEARRKWHTGDMRIPPPVAYALEQLAKHAYPESLPRLQRTTERAPGMPGRLEMRHGLHLLPLAVDALPPATHTNCFVVGDRNLVVIDPAPVDDGETAYLFEQLEALGGAVTAILLTHSHPDHVGAAERVRAHFGAPIRAHAETARQLDFEVDGHIDDGEVIAVDAWELEAIHTPGHDPGHLCFLERSTRTLLAGDMLANPGTVVISRRMGGDMDAYMASLERIKTLEFKMLLPSHGLPLRKPKEQIQKTIEHRLWREERIREAFMAGCRTMDTLVARAYDDTPESLWPLARESADAHLARLGLSIEGD